jgi:HPt (histidine-containing phosphotransfer) domain-containing protein
MDDETIPLLSEEIVRDLEAVMRPVFEQAAHDARVIFAESAAEAARCAAAADFARLRRVVHRLKGGAGSIGAARLHDAANALELAAMLERTDDLMLPLQRLHTVVAATNDALHHRLHHTSRPE